MKKKHQTMAPEVFERVLANVRIGLDYETMLVVLGLPQDHKLSPKEVKIVEEARKEAREFTKEIVGPRLSFLIKKEDDLWVTSFLAYEVMRFAVYRMTEKQWGRLWKYIQAAGDERWKNEMRSRRWLPREVQKAMLETARLHGDGLD